MIGRLTIAAFGLVSVYLMTSLIAPKSISTLNSVEASLAQVNNLNKE